MGVQKLPPPCGLLYVCSHVFDRIQEAPTGEVDELMVAELLGSRIFL
jgi:hypothetical protein